jgi:hypothetical protein
MLDMGMLVRWAVSLCDDEIQPELFSHEYFLSRATFNSATIRDLIQVERSGEWPDPLADSVSVFTAFETLARSSCHRVPIVDVSGKVTAVFTQSMLVTWLFNHLDLSQDGKDLGELVVGDFRKFNSVLTVNEHMQAWIVYIYMYCMYVCVYVYVCILCVHVSVSVCIPPTHACR